MLVRLRQDTAHHDYVRIKDKISQAAPPQATEYVTLT